MRKMLKLLDADIRRKNVEAATWRLRERYYALRSPHTPPPVFIVGCSRSGTTVTYEVLAQSAQLNAFGYELPQFWNALHGPHHNHWDSEAAGAEDAQSGFADRFRNYCFARLGVGRILDKTCINVLRIPFLNALFPEAIFVYIHRDGRANVSSMIDGWHDGRFALTQFLGPSPEPVAIDGGQFSEWHFFLPPGWREFNDAALEVACAHQWNTANDCAMDARAGIASERWIEFPYEDIFDRPAALFASVFERIGVEFTPAIRQYCDALDAHPTSMVSGPPARDKWRQRNPEAVERILPMIRPTMTRLGRTC